MNLKKYLNQPFPKQEKKWKLVISISIFVALFLIIFQPFRINLAQNNNKVLILAGYGLVTFCTLVINLIIIEDIFSNFFDERNWKIWKEFIWLLWIIFSIGLGNALYTTLVFGMYFNVDFSFYINFQLFTLLVGFMPITALILTKQKYLVTKYSNSADELNQNLKTAKGPSKAKDLVQLISDNQKDIIEFNLSDFLFIESCGNYIEVHYLEEKTEKKETIRSTIKKCLNIFKQTEDIIQCHRAFIVNINKVINVKGNSQGLKLSLTNCQTEVPVSRNNVEFVKKVIK